MKNKLNILFTVLSGLLLFGITSCDNDNYLTVDRYTILDTTQMYLTDADAKAGLVGCYDLMLPCGDIKGDGDSDADGDWGIKPNLFVGAHPAMETTATGWDKDWNTQSWNASSGELLSGWQQAYKAIATCNNFLDGLSRATNITPSLKTTLDGEARCIRAFFYDWLAKTFGRVPLLQTGETYANTKEKARAKDYAEMWDFIIADLLIAKDELEWEPMNLEYGRMTKGFAISYLAECYMWKAYRIPTTATENYTLAAAALKEVIESGRYALNASFTTLFDPGAVWTKECIWEEVLDEGSGWNFGSNLTDAHDWMTYYTACPDLGGWGTLYLTWEWWSHYEQGDKRRDASGVTGTVPDINPEWKSATNYGYHPYLQQSINSAATSHYKFTQSGELAPAIWSLKYWRTCRSDWDAAYGPVQIYYKRYANVLLDYAECLFRLNEGVSTEAWGYIKQIRERAFGNDEVGKSAELTATYLPYYQSIATFYMGKTKDDGSRKNPEVVYPETYPIPFNETLVTVPDAQTYYTQLKADKGFESEVWLVALGMERLKEFNAEWTIAPDLIRSEFIKDHIDHNYPKGVGNTTDNNSWQTYRSYDVNLTKMTMPIPSDEILKNPACDQNEGY
jgi:hypothetical protein